MKIKGYRKIIVFIIAFIWAIIAGLLFKNSDVIIPIYSFGSSVILYLFVSNYGEHREERLKINGEFHGKDKNLSS